MTTPAPSRSHNLTVNHFDLDGWTVSTCEERDADSRLHASVDNGLLRFAVVDASGPDAADAVVAQIGEWGVGDGLASAALTVNDPAVSFAGVEWRLDALTAWRCGDTEVWVRTAGSWSQLLPGETLDDGDTGPLPPLTAGENVAYVYVSAAEEIIVAGRGAHLDADRIRDIAAWIVSGVHETTEDRWDLTVVWARRSQ